MDLPRYVSVELVAAAAAWEQTPQDPEVYTRLFRLAFFEGKGLKQDGDIEGAELLLDLSRTAAMEFPITDPRNPNFNDNRSGQ